MDKKPYSGKRWTDIPKPRSIGHREFTDEEKKQNSLKAERLLKKYGALTSDKECRRDCKRA